MPFQAAQLSGATNCVTGQIAMMSGTASDGGYFHVATATESLAGATPYWVQVNGTPGTQTNMVANIRVDGATVYMTASDSMTATTLVVGTTLANTTAMPAVTAETSTGTQVVFTAASLPFIVYLAAPPDLTDGERMHYEAARAARQIHQQWRHTEERLRRERAAKKARTLLLSHLDTQQRADFEQYGAFNVVSLSRRRYRIRQGRSGNVDLFDAQGEVAGRLCIHPREWVPDEDTMLAQLLMIRYAEEEFLRLANLHPPVRGLPDTAALPPLPVAG